MSAALPAWVADWWRPIETAPLDRTPVLITCPSLRDGEQIVGEAYFNPEDSYGGSWWWAGTSDGEYADSPIIDTNSAPTHWMPMPPPARAVEQLDDGASKWS